MKKIKIFLSLTKFKIAFLSTFSGVLGFYLFKRDFYGLFFIFLSLYFLASGSLSLNQYIERDLDKLMKRTENRPIVRGDISPALALLISLLLIILGLFLLLLIYGFIPFILGFITFFIYIFIYTPLKKISPFAFVPGSLIGALPPLIGWKSAGGNINSPLILTISLYFLIWQIPHFMLLFYSMSEDYKKAGFKTIKDVFSEKEIKIILSTWISGTLILNLTFPFFNLMNSYSLYLAFSLFTLFVLFAILIFLKNFKKPKKIFNILNFYTLSLILILIIDKKIGT